jgi:hypothetical protein
MDAQGKALLWQRVIKEIADKTAFFLHFVMARGLRGDSKYPVLVVKNLIISIDG